HLAANAFVGLNVQDRKFRDFHAWESQNWIMAEGDRPVGRSRIRVSAVFLFEPFTLPSIGSPQVFQTGETYHNAPLIDYQHPHDLFMGLGADGKRPLGGTTLVVGFDVVGTPTLGPTPFMHRPSAAENPQVPLAHHEMDSTHSTPGVIR